jgi:hypothetical protein
MRRLVLALALYAGFFFEPYELQAAERLDDSASPRSRVAPLVVIGNDGRPLAQSMDATAAIVQLGRVEYRLATARYLGQETRIYYVVPTLVEGLRSPAALRVEWRGDGTFGSGAARAGERQLVWTGTVREPWMSTALEVAFNVDLQQMQFPRNGVFGFEPYFEIEVAE